MKSVLLFLLILHALIHLMGFIKAFGLAQLSGLKQHISKTNGVLWLLAALLLGIAAFALGLRAGNWWIPATAGLLLSQYCIFISWRDARFGSIANSILLLFVVSGYGAWHFSGTYRNEVNKHIQAQVTHPIPLLTEKNIAHLPEPVKKYIRYTGSLNKPQVYNFKVEFKGQIRKSAASEWMNFTSEQFNFIQPATRLFYMKAVMKHLPVEGFHCFNNGKAFMDIRLFGLLKVQYQNRPEMDTAETVTFFNDMCVMAPATLIDKRIEWLQADSNKVQARFTLNGISITAWLYFNEKGELINFISDNRYASAEDNVMKKLRWATPMKDYHDVGGYKLPAYAETIYTYPEGDFCYGNFTLTRVQYNCSAH